MYQTINLYLASFESRNTFSSFISSLSFRSKLSCWSIFTSLALQIYHEYSGNCQIRLTNEPVKCVRMYRISEYSRFNLVNRNTLDNKFLSDVCKLMCRIAQVALYIKIPQYPLPIQCHSLIGSILYIQIDISMATPCISSSGSIYQNITVSPCYLMSRSHWVHFVHILYSV